MAINYPEILSLTSEDSIRTWTEKDAILYVSDVWNLATAGTTVHDTSNMLEALKPRIEAGHIRIVGEAAPETLSRMLQVPAFVPLFQQVPVRPLEGAQVTDVVRALAAR